MYKSASLHHNAVQVYHQLRIMYKLYTIIYVGHGHNYKDIVGNLARYYIHVHTYKLNICVLA